MAAVMVSNTAWDITGRVRIRYFEPYPFSLGLGSVPCSMSMVREVRPSLTSSSASKGTAITRLSNQCLPSSSFTLPPRKT